VPKRLDDPSCVTSRKTRACRLGRCADAAYGAGIRRHRCGLSISLVEEARMAIRVSTDDKSGTSKIQFVLPDDVHDGPVSAVGDFNDWRPGVHKLVRRSNGTRSVSITVPAGQELRFRYLGSGGVWFDDPEAVIAGCVRT
jgi:hypothetical protein